MTVYKYPLKSGLNHLTLPRGAQVLRVDAQNNSFQLWALVDPKENDEIRVFQIFGTGHTIPDLTHPNRWRFINTFLVNGGVYVFHAFEQVSFEY